MNKPDFSHLFESLSIEIPEGNFSLLSNSEIENFVKNVRNFVEEGSADCFKYHISKNIGKNITAGVFGFRRVEQIIFRYKNLNYNPFFAYRIIYNVEKESYECTYKADPVGFEELSFDKWEKHPETIKIKKQKFIEKIKKLD